MITSSPNSLFLCPVIVRPGKNCDFPSHLIGATVPCFVADTNYESAVRKAVKRLSEQGYIFEDLFDYKVHQLDPQQWDDYVSSTWSEFRNHFPAQTDVIKLVEMGGMFFGPFCAWQTES